MNEPVNGVSLAENYLDIHLRGAEGKKTESPYLPLKSDYLSLQHRMTSHPKNNFFSLDFLGKGFWVSWYHFVKSKRQKLVWRCLLTSVRSAGQHSQLSPPLPPEGLLCHGPHHHWHSGNMGAMSFHFHLLCDEMLRQFSSSLVSTYRKDHLKNSVEVYFPK